MANVTKKLEQMFGSMNPLIKDLQYQADYEGFMAEVNNRRACSSRPSQTSRFSPPSLFPLCSVVRSAHRRL